MKIKQELRTDTGLSTVLQVHPTAAGSEVAHRGMGAGTGAIRPEKSIESAANICRAWRHRKAAHAWPAGSAITALGSIQAEAADQRLLPPRGYFTSGKHGPAGR